MTYFGLPYIHAVFDVAAWLASMTAFWLVTRHLLPADALPANRVPHPGAYAIAAGAGALCGAMFFGTANALLSGVHALGFSMVGGIAGAIASIEAFKRFTGVTRLDRHRLRRALRRHRGGRPLGLLLLRPRRLHLRHADRPLPWGVDFGDGIARHPVQLYESFAMAAMFVVLILRFRARDRLLAQERLLPHRRLVWAAALRVGILQALCNRDRPVQPLPCGLPRPGPVRCRHDPQRGPRCTMA